MIKCVGVRFGKGTFTRKDTGESFDFDNVYLNLVKDTRRDNLYGLDIEELKIKRSLFPDKKDADWVDFADKELDIVYDVSRGRASIHDIRIVKK